MKEKAKSLIGEFKEFISRGNVMDMAVGVIIGTAFTAIVNSLVKDVVMPAIGYLIGGIDFTEFKIVLSQAVGEVPETAIYYGTFIQNIINFLLIALVVFLMVKAINLFHRKKEEPITEEAPEEPEISAELAMLTEIRDLLKEQKNQRE
ncbi:large-conductance mechanosensitive channel protein MscL [Zongyangia hominis]|uniref:Large-conductance mechanosensitive channel n=1 Tax=Zongyangia hominis TaxID=2763677 RepID=A0A926EAU9_9FIRM|nr:large-conductance mechanosensitive channel protein MscL [Zongyangia hominis]MBC8570502.1 large-conductance mechanosensitive channel protein MscL [Zongyangia hominis]